MPPIIVKGGNIPPPPPGSPHIPELPARLNITDLMKNEMQWSLYIQALVEMKEDNWANPLSWFSLSSIHGYPLDLQWQDGGKKTNPGYCTHSNPRFPTWHRLYLALYEQALQIAAVKVSKRYTTDSDAWGRAALTLRSPYWDWADSNTYLPPPQVYDYENFQTLNVITPNGAQDIPNPLLAYTFQREIEWPDGSGLSQYQATVRRPNKPDPLASFKDVVGVQASRGNLRLHLWMTLNWTSTWTEFSNTRAGGNRRANSLESLHDWIHARAGGHMGNPISAAYDPLFMLHHTNVDRLLALWQALHPEAWISESDGEKALKPFWKTNDAFHRSADEPVRNFIKFGATYPEFVGLENSTPDEKKKIIQGKVDMLYNPQNVPPGINVLPAPVDNDASVAPPDVASTAPADVTGAPPTDTSRIVWFVRIRVKKFQLNQTYKVLIFLGLVPDDPAEWILSHNLVGSHSVFVNSAPESCAGCLDNLDMINEGFVDLTTALERNGYENRSKVMIERFIRDQIDWRIWKVDGTVVPAKELEVLEVAVTSLDVTDSNIEHPLVLHDITSHRDGGFDPNHQPYHL